MLKNGVLVLMAVVFMLFVIGVFPPIPQLRSFAQSDTSCRTFSETGKTVCGRFLAFWQRNGALPVFGYPISNPFLEKNELDSKEYRVQYFERAIFELHPENQAPYDVLLSQLGTFRFNSRYSGSRPDGPDEDNLPLYLSARNVEIQHIQVAVPDQDVINITTFETADSPEAIMAFYDDILYQKNGWSTREVRGMEYVRYVYVPANGGAVYGLSIETVVTRIKTNVTLRLYKTLPK